MKSVCSWLSQNEKIKKISHNKSTLAKSIKSKLWWKKEPKTRSINEVSMQKSGFTLYCCANIWSCTELWWPAACQSLCPAPPCWVVGRPVNEVFVPGANPRTGSLCSPPSRCCPGPCTRCTKAQLWTFNPSASGAITTHWLEQECLACGVLKMKG